VRTKKEVFNASRAFAVDDARTSWKHVLATLLVLAGLLVIVCSPLPWLVRLPFSLLEGLLIIRLFVIYHDHQHGTILSDSRAADWLMRGFGMLVLSPASSWQRTHDHHHARNMKLPSENIGTFPLLDVETYRNASRGERFLYVAMRHPLTVACAYIVVFLVGMCLVPLIANPRRHRDAALALAGHLGLALWLGYAAPDVLVLGLLIPFWLSSALGALLFYVQHNFAGARVYRTENWSPAAAALDSSSYVQMGTIARWLTGNIGYHHVHHLNDHIPFYRLPEAMAAIPELQTPVTLTLSLLDICNCFRQNLWDSAGERLVSWSALRSTAQPAAEMPQACAG
jgi:omega-6 fatty acid desaturase (delta-12 desaturase)